MISRSIYCYGCGDYAAGWRRAARHQWLAHRGAVLLVAALAVGWPAAITTWAIFG